MKRYEVYARFPLVTDKGAKNTHIAALADTVEMCNGTIMKVEDYGERLVVRPPSNVKYSQSHSWDVCLYFDLPQENASSLKRLLRVRIADVIRFIVVESRKMASVGLSPGVDNFPIKT